jgi:hypothetical protein
MDVYVLWYARPLPNGFWTGMNIGYYSSLKRLEEARERLRQRPGFRDFPNGFSLNCYRLDEEYDNPMFFTAWERRRQAECTLEEAIGLQAMESPFTVLLPRHSHLPASFSKLLPTHVDDQPVARVQLVAGDPSRAGEARQLSELVIPNLPPGPRQAVRVPIWVAVDERGSVLIAARHPQTGEVLSVLAGTVAVKSGGAEPDTPVNWSRD